MRAFSLPVAGVLVWTLVLAGCSGSSTTAITLAPATGPSLNPGGTVTITATVAHDKTNQGVTWTLSGPGTLSGNTTTSVVYTAPSNLSTATTATITATSVASSGVTATESITLNAVLTITTTSLPSGTLGVPYSPFVNATGATGTFTWTVTSGSLPPGLTLTTISANSAEITGTPSVLGISNFTIQVTDAAGASVTQALSITINAPPPLAVITGSLSNGTDGVAGYSQTLQASGGVPPYTWNVASGQLPPGLTLNSGTGVISGKPLAAGTYGFTVNVVDSSTSQQSASATLSIRIDQGITDNPRLKGPYAFSVRGFDMNGLFVAAGSFIADGNGNISSGVMDINNTGTPVNETFSGTYSIDGTGLGFMIFNITTGGTRSFEVSLTAKGDVTNIIEYDDTGGFAGNTARNSGVLLRQDTNSLSIQGGYAFGFSGIDSGKNRFGMAGDFQADSAGNLTSGLLDSDDASSGVSSAVAFTGTYTPIAPSGRSQATIKTAQGTSVYSFYVVNSGEVLVVGFDPFAGGNPLVSGTILRQTSNSDFTGASIFEMTALDLGPSGPTAESQVGQFEAITGNFNVTESDQRDGLALNHPTGSGTYSIASGRVTLGPTGSGFQNSLPVFYMVNNNEAFIIGTDTAVSFGFMTPQSSFTLPGTYAGGSLPPVAATVSNVVSIAIAGPNSLDLTEDISNNSGLSHMNSSEAATSPDSHGRVLVTLNGNDANILYMVSSAEFFALSADPADTSARVDIFQQ